MGSRAHLMSRRSIMWPHGPSLSTHQGQRGQQAHWSPSLITHLINTWLL